jgi:hypothetical protein
MSFHRFHNALRILLSTDRVDLDDAGLPLNNADWAKFQADPFRFFIKANDTTAQKLWALVEARQPKELV